MGLLFITTETQDIVDKLNRVFSKSKIAKMRASGRYQKFSTDYTQGRSLARCAKTFKLHPGKDNFLKPALRWFWLLRRWAQIPQTDPDPPHGTANMADLIKKWIYEGLADGSPSFTYNTIKFLTGSASGAPYATIDRTGKVMTITAYTPDVPTGVETHSPYNLPPGPDPDENPADPEDPVDDPPPPTPAKKTGAKKKAAKKKAAKKKI